MKCIKNIIITDNFATYHSSIYREIYKIKKDTLVIYKNDKGKKNYYEPRWKRKISWKLNLTKGYKYLILNKRNNLNYLFSVILILIKIRPEKILVHGYSLNTFFIVFFSNLFCVKFKIWKGEVTNDQYKSISLLKKIYLKTFYLLFNKVLYTCIGNLEFLKLFSNKKKLIAFNCSVDNSFYTKKYMIGLRRKELLKKKFHQLNDNKIVLWIGNFEKRKNIFQFLESVKFFENEKVSFIIAGDGFLKNEIKKKILIYKKKVTLIDFVDVHTLSELFSIADLFVLLSLYDPSPKILNEAINFRVPILITDYIGTSKDLVKGLINGIVIKKISAIKTSLFIKRLLFKKDIILNTTNYNRTLLKKYSPNTNAITFSRI
jgi:hypothetical protein